MFLLITGRVTALCLVEAIPFHIEWVSAIRRGTGWREAMLEPIYHGELFNVAAVSLGLTLTYLLGHLLRLPAMAFAARRVEIICLYTAVLALLLMAVYGGLVSALNQSAIGPAWSIVVFAAGTTLSLVVFIRGRTAGKPRKRPPRHRR